MKTKLLLFSFLLVVTSVSVFGQTYIASDTFSLTGVRIITGTRQENTYSIKVMHTNKVTKVYTPKNLNEYRLSDGSTYIAREINVSGFPLRVFLRQLVKGKLNLYHYDGREASVFLLEHASSGLINLIKEGEAYKTILLEQMQDCKAMESNIKITKYNQNQLSSLVKQYNTCSPKPIVFAKYGVLAGIAITKQDASEIFKKPSFENYVSPTVGAYADIPLFNSNLSLNIAPYISKNNYADNMKYVVTESSNLFGFDPIGIATGEIYIQNEYLSVDIPLSVRYTFLKSRIRPFVCGGAVYSFNFKNKGKAYFSSFEEINSEVIVHVTEKDAPNLTDSRQLGYTFGGGIQYAMHSRKSIIIEIRSSKMSAESTSLNRNQLILFTAFTF